MDGRPAVLGPGPTALPVQVPPVSALPVLSERARRRQLVEWNRTEVAYPDDGCLHELIAEQAQRTPEAMVSDGRTRLTFGELDERAGRLASRLRQLGVGPEELVGICMQRSTDVVVALLGILKAGGAFMPLEPDQPRQRLALMLSEAQPRVVLTTAEDARVLPPTSAHTLRIDSERDSWMSEPPVVATDCGPANLAYVLFTSGSTGTPKGVMVEHRSLVNHLRWRNGSFGLTPEDRILQKTPLGFDPALSEVFCPLLTGASLTLLRPGDHAHPGRLAKAVRDEHITVLGFVPSMLEEFVAAADAGELGSLRLVTCGGDTISPALVRSFFNRFGPDVELRNMYGPAEAVISASSWRCDPSSQGAVPIGRPVANTQIYLLDADLRPVPIGAPGELCIGGTQVARGYLNQPGLTAQRFVANPFRPGERIYRTGDMARYRSDGAIEFLGREDHQIKVRGNRIECGEVESVLAAHPAVAKAVVVVRTDEERREQRLVAYFVPAEEGTPRLGELRAHLGSHLPAYMMPAAFVTLEALPLTPSGKVDRGALPAAEAGRLGVEAGYVAARTDAEVTLAEIWAQLLHVDRIGTEDNFFELGGDSIDAIRVIARANRAGLRLSQAQLFEHPTVAGLAAAAETVEEMAGEGTVEDSVARSLPRTTSDTGNLTPSDFPLAGLDQATLDRLLG